MSTDLSAAPEIAQFAQFGPAGGPADPPDDPPSGTRTLGETARELMTLAADPRIWWDRVRFDPDAPLTIALGNGGWLLVTPPLAAVACDCHLATLLAGEAAEDGAPLRHGRARIHGRRQTHLVTGTAAGFAVSLHSGVRPRG